MKVSEKAFDFAQTLVKFYSPNLSQKKQTNNTLIDEQGEDQPQVPQDPLNKFSINYKKFDLQVPQREEAKKEQEQMEMIKSNPYLQQVACTHDRRKERELYEKSTQEKLDNAEYFKEQGNQRMKEKDFKQAAYLYQKALIHFDYAFPDTLEEQKRFDLLKEQCHNNLAQCKLSLKNYDETLIHCNQVLKLNKYNTKALYRKAQVYLAVDDYQACQDVISQLFQISANNPELSTLQETLKLKQSDYLQKTQKIYSQLFKK